MPKSLSSVQKKITKKKGKSNSLHENSRDSQRLRRAGARSDKLGRVASARKKANKTHINRIKFFQEAAKAATGPIEARETQALIQRYLERHDEEIEQIKAERRSGRPPSNREHLMRERHDTEHREYNTGFWLPDMEDEKTLELLQNWNGEWASLSNFNYVRLTRIGAKTQSNFPPKGKS